MVDLGEHTASQRPPAPGRFVDVGGTPMHAVVDGSGGPTVVLESGLGGGVLEWGLVAAALSAHTTVVRRDRPGLGWSPYAVRPRTAVASAQDLRAVLQALDVDPPYLLVGHSLGGLHIRAFAAAHPDEVAGLVFVDSSHEDFFDNERAQGRSIAVVRGLMGCGLAVARLGGTALLRKLYMSQVRRELTKPVSADVEAILEAIQARQCATDDWIRAMRDEAGALSRSCAEIRALRRDAPFPVVPIRVISQGRPAPKPRLQELGDRFRDVYHADLATLALEARHVIAERSGHLVPLDQPEVVIDAVTGLLGLDPAEPIATDK